MNMEISIKDTNHSIVIPNQSVTYLHELRELLDQAERNQTNNFANFSDLDMIYWFLYEEKHVDENDERSERSTISYKSELEQFCTYLVRYAADIGIDIKGLKEGSLFKSLQPRHLLRYQEWLEESSPYVQQGKNYSKATLERKTTVLRMFFNYLYAKGYISESLTSRMKIVRTKSNDRPNRDMVPKDVVRVLDAFIKTKNAFMFTLVQTLVTTGLRNEELCKLTVGSVKQKPLGDGYYIEVHGKGNKKRNIPLRDKVVQSIEIFRGLRGLPSINNSNPEDPLFTTSKGKAYSPPYLSKLFSKEMEKIAPYLDGITLTCTPHVFRHAFAIISHYNEVDVFSIMRSLGHEKIETTMIYLQKSMELDQHASNYWRSDMLNNLI
ncbi:integrase [Butyricicoccus sp. 1XD8-22]|nr:integrase [Butyricicoccus sp. 1XD8-22]